MGPALISELHPNEEVFETRVLANDTVGLSNVRSFEDHPCRREGDVVTQECSSPTHLLCNGIKSRDFWSHHDPIDTLSHGFIV